MIGWVSGVRRWWLLAIACCWLALAVSYSGASPLRRWAPGLVAILGYCAFAFTVWLAAMPRSIIAYRFGGTMAIGCLLFQGASVAVGLSIRHEEDWMWFEGAAIGTSILLILLYGRWWLEEVGPWHAKHRARHDPG